jgi:hypothetical protein
MPPLKTAIRQLAGLDLSDELHLAVGTVTGVDLSNMACSVELFGAKTLAIRNDVRIMAAVDDGFLPVPAIGSQVIVAWSTRNQPYVAMFSQLQDVYLSADNLVTLQGDDFGGLVKVGELVTRLNAIENLLNNFISLYNGHTHTDPASGSTGTPSAPEPNTATLTQVTDIENPKVVHGN